MTKARDLADLISAGNPLADGSIAASEVTGLAAVATSGAVADVSGAAPTASPTFTGTVTSSGNININKDDPQIQLQDTGSGGTIWRITNGPDGNGKLTFNDNDTERVTFTNTGNVGIGTNAPAKALHVNGGELRIQSSDYGRVEYVRGTTTIWTTGPRNSNDYYVYREGGGGNVVFEGGNIGVGTSSPETKLHVSGGDILISNNQFVYGENSVGGNSKLIGRDSADTLYVGDSNYNNPTVVQTGNSHLQFNTNGTEKFRIEGGGTAYFSYGVQQGYSALSGTTPTIDADVAGSFALTTSGNTTFTFASVVSGRTHGFVLKLTAGGTHTITWPSSIDWAGATAPDAPASGETDVLVFYTVDGGTNWYGALAIDAAG